ncbi:hypothetical protein [Flavobacterium sp. SORGH_AS_0622]|uniref:hypothetical protein n=1 Tax=Flavobacterium sp. SORGH_AS_0622 TaxID=3041772 RepID=UPI0027804813|nr:hypothetical protein [Flavobacterium sp. SORGH_AS_0622]MDQ1164611.1 hypothetical protein [Flavobacterium sp. SORGH_AS_0622]
MKLNLFLIFTLVVVTINAQNRMDDALPIITKKSSALILATGWLKNSSGQWISGKNKIPQDLGENQKLLGNYESYGLGTDNFISIEIKDVKIVDSTYAIIIKKYRDGFYTYSSIQKGWNNKVSCKYYVVSKAELAKAYKLTPDYLNKTTVRILYEGILMFINTQTFNDRTISKDLASNIKENSNHRDFFEHKLGLNIYYFKAKNLVQFYLYDANSYSMDMEYEDDESQKGKKYYETDAVTFKNFLNFSIL